MKVNVGSIDFFLEEHEKPKVIHQQGSIILNYSHYDYRDNRSDLKKLSINFSSLKQLNMTIELLKNLSERLEKGDDSTVELLFDNDGCWRLKK